MSELDAVFSALSDPTRREVMRLISEAGEASATELSERLPITRQAVMKHLNSLSEAGLIQGEQAGKHKRYRLTPAPMETAMGWMAEVGSEWDERLESLERFIARRR